jgi:ribosomal protein S18 acetylase RimI-like enzyme
MQIAPPALDPQPPRFKLRPATPDDAHEIAHVEFASWRSAYAALLPRSAFRSVDLGERASRWRNYLTVAATRPKEAVFVAARMTGGDVVGFGSCGPQRSDRLAPLGFAGEIWALYLAPGTHRLGLGRALMGVMAQRLTAQGFAGLSVWVFRDNHRARRFYEALGGEETGVDGAYEFLGVDLPDLAYGWRDATPLAQRHQ